MKQIRTNKTRSATIAIGAVSLSALSLAIGLAIAWTLTPANLGASARGEDSGTNLAYGGRGNSQGNGLGNGQGNGQGRGSGLGRNQGTNTQGTGANGDYEPGEDLITLVANLPKETLSNAERASLISMGEEEKLAHDVYLALYATWNIPVFNNIAQSEATHMESIKYLLDRYQIADPIGTKAPGQYTNPAFTQLYRDLVAKGSKSLQDAFSVGATVEDLDIDDLEKDIIAADNQDINILYQNLAKASRNHIRSFIAQLQRAGGTYTAQRVSPTYLATTLAMNREIAPITTANYRFNDRAYR